jgi:hypothetical protein
VGIEPAEASSNFAIIAPMTADDTIDVGEALETLVHQFADPWSFLRELIQNALDADSREIDVRISHEVDRGVMLVEVVDSGTGMDRQIIDTRLTRLFSSSKDGDYTKIGRFGIGFVSVFAIAPDVVCVDTGKNGEYWRVLFREDRSFERIVLDTPIEGTTITLYKRATAAEVEQARVRAREVLGYWCKHAYADIRLDDEPISQPMQLDAHCVVSHEEDGTKLLLGYVAEREALRGYYHGGLTLHEEHDDRLPHVAVKIDSRYLEHTLTRDNVIRDDNYAKAMQIVGRVAQTKLVEALLDTLAQWSASGHAEIELLRWRLAELLASGQSLPAWVFERPLVPRLHASGQTELLTLAQVGKLGKRVYVASGPSPITDALLRESATILLAEHDSALVLIIQHTCGRQVPHVSSLCAAVPCTSEPASWPGLSASMLALLGALDIEPSTLALAQLDYHDSSVAEQVAITQAKLGELTPVGEVSKLSVGWRAGGWLAGKRAIVVNADHPSVVQLLELAAREPELAAYLLLKQFFLRTELDAARSDELAMLAAEARWRRQTA